MATVAIPEVRKASTLRYNISVNLWPEWTMDRLIEELYLCLMKCSSSDYQQQAFKLIYKIPIYRPTPHFEIKISDLSQEVKKELDHVWSYKRELDHILKEAASRIFANINERYFLLSVKHLLKVRLIP